MYADEYNFYAITHRFNLHFIFSTKIFITMRFHHHHHDFYGNGEVSAALHPIAPKQRRKEHIEYYGHGNDTHFLQFLQWRIATK